MSQKAPKQTDTVESILENGETDHLEPESDSINEQLNQLQEKLQSAKDSELRSKADYQNLVRRTQEERSKLIKMASLQFVESLLQPLDHLRLAAEHIQDPGLEMVVKQLWQVLEDNGVKALDIVGKKFDENQMEVVEKEGDGDIVKKIVTQGYTLNGEVIRHAKVVVG
jgi:molecular chaperone GrpE